MKITIKPKVEPQERITLRVPASLKKRMDETRAIADKKGADYYASIVDAIDGTDQEIRAKLLQTGDPPGGNSGDRPGDTPRTTNGSDPSRA